MTTKEWSHLPNAEHIDWVLETLEKNPEVWGVALNAVNFDSKCALRRDALYAARRASWDAGWSAAWDAAWEASRRASWISASIATLSEARRAAWCAITAVISWNSSNELLDKSVKEITKLARAGDHAAVLLLPAVIVKHKLKEKNA